MYFCRLIRYPQSTQTGYRGTVYYWHVQFFFQWKAFPLFKGLSFTLYRHCPIYLQFYRSTTTPLYNNHLFVCFIKSYIQCVLFICTHLIVNRVPVVRVSCAFITIWPILNNLLHPKKYYQYIKFYILKTSLFLNSKLYVYL